MIIGLIGSRYYGNRKLGSIGAGKDTVADYLTERFSFVKMAFGDELKRITRTIFDFGEQQLWGESKYRSTPSKLYFNEHGEGITARVALDLGTNWCRKVCPDLWVIKLRKQIETYLKTACLYRSDIGCYFESAHTGGFQQTTSSLSPDLNVVVSDIRFDNEADMIRSLGGYIVRVERPLTETEFAEIDSDPSARMATHVNESFSITIAEHLLDHTLTNDGSREDLYSKIDHMICALKEKTRK